MNPTADFYLKTRKSRSLLIIDPGMLGDAVQLIPALWDLRQNYPDAELHTICSPVGAEVLKLTGCADRYWVLQQSRKERRLGDQLRILLPLRKHKFDVSINFGDNDRNLIYAGFIHARYRLGRSNGRWHFWSPWCINQTAMADLLVPSFEQRRQILTAAGLNIGQPRFDMNLPEDAIRQAELLLPPDSIHVSINASDPLKEWPLCHWITLVQHLLNMDKTLHIIATGTSTKRELKRLNSLAEGVSNKRLILPKLGQPIADLAAMIKRCRLHIGADSGVLHLAVALGIRTLSIFREYAGAGAWIPKGPKHRVLIAPCACAGQTIALCSQDSATCLHKITPDCIAAAIAEELC